MMLYGSDLEMYVKGEKKGREDGIKVGEARGEKRGIKVGEKMGRTTLIMELINNGTLTLKEAQTKYGFKNKRLVTVD